MTLSTIEMTDVHSFRNVADAQIKPDGSEVAVVVADSFVVDTPLPRSQILIVDATTGQARQLSAGGISELCPRWAPDGQSIAFLSDAARVGELRPYTADRSGSIAPLLTAPLSSSGVVERPRLHTVQTDAPIWAPNGREVAVLMASPNQSTGNTGATRSAHWTGAPLSRVWAIDVSSNEERPISPEGLQVWEYAWSPDGRQLAAITSSAADESSWYEATLTVIDIVSGETRAICSPPDDLAESQPPRKAFIGRQLALPTWSPNGRQLAFICGSMSDRGLIGGDLYVVDLDGSSPKNLTRGLPASVSWYDWDADGTSLTVCAWHEGQQALGRCEVSRAGLEVAWKGEVAFADRFQPRFTRSLSGTIALVREDHTHPRELWLFDAADRGSTAWRQLSTIQPSVDGFAFSTLQTLSWTMPDGTRVQGHLLRPANAPPDAALPMVVFPHGGPTFLHQYLFHSRVEGPYALPFELLAGHGIAVLLPNMRGSLGWGRPFAEANLGDMGGVDLADTIAGVDYCVEAGLADPNRLGYAGWSSSGYLAALVSCITTRFKAVMVGAAVVDMRAMRHVNPSFDKLFYPGDPYLAGGTYDRIAPITQVAEVRSPTLIIHARGDTILPPGQALEWRLALEENGQTPEVVIYENEGHAIVGKDDQADIAQRIVAWFGRHLNPS